MEHGLLEVSNVIIGEFLILLLIGVISWLAANKLNKPYTIFLVIIGLVIGLMNIDFLDKIADLFTKSETFSLIVLGLFLPSLLGEAAMKFEYREIKKYKNEILSLALLGTFITFVLVAVALIYICKLPVVVSFTIASLMCATDPISVMGMFKIYNVKKSIAASLEGESLFNDGIAVVFFKISTVFLLSYINMGLSGIGAGFLLFFKVVLIGTVIGLILGFLASYMISFVDNYPLETMVSFLLFYGSYLLSEHFHGSGVIAVVIGGIVFGNYGKKIGMSAVTEDYIASFWDIISFVGNTILFLLIGLVVYRLDVFSNWKVSFITILIVLIARTIAVNISLLNRKTFTNNEKFLINWGGLKGALSIALALTLPAEFPYRENILLIVYTNVVFSLLIQGLSIPKVIMYIKNKEKVRQ
ncbi:sodium:proton antiporter [Gottfriedia acidiceleris]|uniref:cation:proton antiporter n=1 Tax=Bacillaceae TaxID=186817 RepID=UPI000BEBD92C|nr:MULTISPECIES: sodium:proton antiporter [unclassified Bacillus (in: firmicutes)]PEC49399.1 sodium:proton antiporter [Bacillus sp. AFS096315]PFM82355.1 sodium:proton antiporter [Bacillus sp. AFS077874]